jgi:hypothetical protein
LLRVRKFPRKNIYFYQLRIFWTVLIQENHNLNFFIYNFFTLFYFKRRSNLWRLARRRPPVQIDSNQSRPCSIYSIQLRRRIVYHLFIEIRLFFYELYSFGPQIFCKKVWKCCSWLG